MRSTSVIFSVALALTACDDSKDSGQTARHAIGKADLAGSCKIDDCGDQAAGGNCWCDSACEAFGDCCENAAFVCEAPAPSCDDGSTHSPLCDVPPVCAEGLVKALKSGCFVCVDPQTCEAPAPSCDDGSTHSPLCDVPPVCAEGLVKALKSGCFVCVDPQTCEAPALSCDDGSTHSPLCDVPPVCAEGLVKALKSGCFVCVDPQTCEAPAPAVCSEPACDADAPCAVGTTCLVIAGCGSPVCTTLATACETLGCTVDNCGTSESYPTIVTCNAPQ